MRSMNTLTKSPQHILDTIRIVRINNTPVPTYPAYGLMSVMAETGGGTGALYWLRETSDGRE